MREIPSLDSKVSCVRRFCNEAFNKGRNQNSALCSEGGSLYGEIYRKVKVYGELL